MACSEASVLPAHANNFVYLNASSTTSSLFIVPIELLPTNVKPIKISALLDSGSSHCFLDNSIVDTYKLPTVPVNPPLQLWLIDGTSNHVITQQVNVHARFNDTTELPLAMLLLWMLPAL